jgi:aminopeptidase N
VSLKKSMAWDEQRFGLEYDLDLFNIVAVDDFNMGAMEVRARCGPRVLARSHSAAMTLRPSPQTQNKSLNIFNSRLVLATPETATDGDYMAIESVIAHEYFHNWTGNRVTCQNWFQLSLKEGLTVYRDQEFSADVNSRGVQRLSEVSRLRAAQFPQDSGPLAHPVRPESYVKMDNFYTVTVYEKGAEVVRMYATLLGRAGFRAGMDLYFQRHDGQAVTCDDFLAAMADANGTDLSDFGRWYAQAGTPRVTVTTRYDAAAQTVTLACSQHTPATPGQSDKLPVVIPLAVGLLDPVTGKDLRLSLVTGPGSLQGEDGTTAVLRFSTREATFVLKAHGAKDAALAPVPSLLRDFSAPVVLECADLMEENLVFLMAHDSDPVNRWDAGQTLSRRLLLRLVAAYGSGDRKLEVPPQFVDAMRAVLVSATAAGADKAFIARAMALPSESELIEAVESADPVAVHEVRKHVVRTLATALQPQLQAALVANTVAGPYTNDGPARATRSLKNMALAYLSALRSSDIAAESLRRYKAADNMTDQLAALAALSGHPSPQREEAMAAFAAQWGSDPLVVRLAAMRPLLLHLNSHHASLPSTHSHHFTR